MQFRQTVSDVNYVFVNKTSITYNFFKQPSNYISKKRGPPHKINNKLKQHATKPSSTSVVDSPWRCIKAIKRVVCIQIAISATSKITFNYFSHHFWTFTIRNLYILLFYLLNNFQKFYKLLIILILISYGGASQVKFPKFSKLCRRGFIFLVTGMT